MRALWSLDHALSVRQREISRRFGVTGSQRLVVRIIGQSPGISAGEVARVLHVHPSTLTPTLQGLLERGLLRRAADPADRRRAVLWLTKQGERLDAASAALVDRAVRRALARHSGSEVFSARRVLHAIAAEVLGADAARAVRATSHRKVAGEPARRASSGGGRDRERERGAEVRPARPRASAARSA
jgi:DNA-binding MarR family transcriptional regulator